MSAAGILQFLKRWWPLLVLGPLVAGTAGYFFVGRVPAVYQATTTLLVHRVGVGANAAADDPAGSESLGRTYAEALKTRPVLQAAAQEVGLSRSDRELQQAVATRPVTGTQLLQLTVDESDPNQAAQLANAIVAVFSQQNQELQTGQYARSQQSLEQLLSTLAGELNARSAELQQLRSTLPPRDPQLTRLESDYTQLQATYNESLRSYESLRVTAAQGLNGLTVVDPAVAPTDPIRPNKPTAIALAVLAGLVAAAAIARVADLLDDGLDTRQRLAAATGLRALGSIPRWRVGDGSALACRASESATDRDTRRAAESFRLLLSSLMLGSGGGDDPPRAVMVTSAARDEGRSLTAANLAAVFAETGRSAILVDADIHEPTQSERFQLPNLAGLSTLLLNPDSSLDSLLRSTSVPGLRVLTAGPQPAAPSALFTSQRLKTRLSELREQCDLVVFDTPPVLTHADAALLARHLDGELFVVDARRSRGRQVRRAIEQLGEAGATILGATLNAVSPRALGYVRDRHAEAANVQPEHGATTNNAVTTPARGAAG